MQIFYLSFISAPIAPPRAVQVQDAQSRRFTINWQAPPCLQTNGEVREYEYEATGVDPWASREQYRNRIGDTRASVDGLTPFTKYRVKVRAWTSQGSGPWSQEIIVTTASSGNISFFSRLRKKTALNFICVKKSHRHRQTCELLMLNPIPYS